MNDTDRVIGELKEFKRATLTELSELKREVRDLSSYRWRATGAIACLMALVEAVHMVLSK